MDLHASHPGQERPLRENVRDVLRTRIFDGHYAPGTRLVERDLAAEFGVSRLPIREALRMLRQEGLVSERANSRGMVVSRLSPEEVADLFDVRQALEVLACQLAAVRASDADLAELAELLEAARRAVGSGALHEAEAANAEFHEAVTRIAGNGFLRSALEPLQGRMHWLYRQPHDLRELIREHEDLLAAISSRNPERAARQSREHIQKYRKQYYQEH
ncbi:GntR family transcriptional regulator [Arthrobacter sp. GCM10027362]|uniref:GntR family transcriptional regulator n=1 Tax=Arthrobacter sp. GCM10027362 TaxID=3273379 RepID=UPI00362AEB27